MGTNLQLVHEAEAQRQHVRLKLPLQATIRDNVYTVVDWSVGGLCLEGLRPLPEVGDLIDVKLHFAFEGFQFTLQSWAEIRHASQATGRVGCRFASITPQQISLLQYVIDAYISGEVVRSGDLLAISQRNMFVSPRKVPAKERPPGFFARALDRLRGAAIAALTVGIGLAVFAYAAFAIYTHSFVTDGKGIVVSPQIELARAPIGGTITPYTGSRGKQVAVKELIAMIEAPDGTKRTVESPCDCFLANEPLPQGSYVSRGTVIARLVPMQAASEVEMHVPLTKLVGIEAGQRARIDLFGGHPPVWGSVERLARHTPMETGGLSDVSYGVIFVKPDAQLPLQTVGEPVAVQIHRLGWLGRRLAGSDNLVAQGG